jgi:hypothetical protein
MQRAQKEKEQKQLLACSGYVTHIHSEMERKEIYI